MLSIIKEIDFNNFIKLKKTNFYFKIEDEEIDEILNEGDSVNRFIIKYRIQYQKKKKTR